MGLFDFVSGIGNKIFGKEEEGGDKLKEHIEKDNPGVENLNVEVKDGVAVLKGQANSKSAFEKAILMAGNALGVQTVQAEELTYPQQAATSGESEAPAAAVEYYEIQKGDTLWAVATKFYDDGNKYKKIFEDNKEVIKDPDLIFPGQKIRIIK